MTLPKTFLALLLAATPLVAAPIFAVHAREPVTPEQRIRRVELQVREIQRTVYPKGQPADTAGFSDDPAASKEVTDTLAARLDTVERQLTDLVRTSEENTHRLSVIEADLARMRADNDGRFKAIEAGPGAASTGDLPQPVTDVPAPIPTPRPTPRPTASAPVSFDAAGEAAYTAGFDLWSAKKYDSAITQLRAMASSFPGHRRVSWANNLVGRALLDKGETRAAAAAFLANYRGNPKGERAADSLYYLGQSTMKLGQPQQACKAYEELGAVYGATLRPQLAAMLPAARAQAGCK